MDVIKSKRRQIVPKAEKVKTELDLDDILNIQRRNREAYYKSIIRCNKDINQFIELKSKLRRMVSLSRLRSRSIRKVVNNDLSDKYLPKYKKIKRSKNLSVSTKTKKYYQKYYQGFQIYSIGTWTNSIIDENNNKLYVFETPMLYLELKKENLYYPYKFMIVCINFEIECGGKTLKDAEQCMCDRYNNFFQYIFKSSVSDENIQAVKNEIKQNNIWKETFKELYDIFNRGKFKIKNYHHKWKIK